MLTGAFCILQFPFAFECEWSNGNSAVHKSFKLPFTLKNINIFYFEMSRQIAIWPFSIKKKVQKFLNSQMTIQPYTSHSAVHTQLKRNLRRSNHTLTEVKLKESGDKTYGKERKVNHFWQKIELS